MACFHLAQEKGPVAGSCESGDESLGFTKDDKFLEQPSK
jgi:hypothetical protein